MENKEKTKVKKEKFGNTTVYTYEPVDVDNDDSIPYSIDTEERHITFNEIVDKPDDENN